MVSAIIQKPTSKKLSLQGRAPTHQLYPAMPYPSYHGMADADISALFAYFQTVPPVEESPENITKLPFPLNIRTNAGLERN